MRLSGFKLPVEHLSASSLSDFLACPEKFRQERIVKVEKRRYVDGFVGSVHHDTIEENFSQKIFTEKDQSLEQQKAVYTYKWAEQIEAEGEPVWTEHPDKVEAMGLRMVESFHKEIAPTIQPIAVEQRFEESVPGLPVPVIGYIDVEEKESIQEFKTSKQKVSSPKPNWRFQASVYQLMSRKPVYWTVTTKQVTPVNWYWQNAPDLLLPVGDVDVTARMIVQAATMMNDYWQRYGANEPWPMTGLLHPWICGYCAVGPKHPDPKCLAWRTHDPPAN